MIYLDYAAHTPADEAVLQCFCETERRYGANPNSAHAAGNAARERLAAMTEAIAGLLGVEVSEIIYTSGASEANNTAVRGLAQRARKWGNHILSTPLEHASVSGSLEALRRQGFEVEHVAVGADGKVVLEDLQKRLRADTVLVAVTAVDSELGVIQPIREIGEIVHGFPHCRLHVDATQAIGKTAFSFDGIDTASFAPHKFYGLNGSGVLFKRRGVELEPLIYGGAGATPYRSGTPTLSLAAATEAALRLALTRFDERLSTVRTHCGTLRRALAAYPLVRINSPTDAVPHILNLSVQNVKGTVFQRMLDEKGVCVSVKSACSSDGAPSQAVLAVSGDRKNALSSWRISLSHLTTADQVQSFLAIFDSCYQALTGTSPR